ncbi:hypothetical protein GCM10027052_08800 [Parafrigoribacterium mesophilum]|uniref:hypothetical protein n=1 Tax=Parafrigoribacterium mesophilum TaxID=433646 RepID=UPI0031FC8BDF
MANSKSKLWWRRFGTAVACGALVGTVAVGPVFAADGAAGPGSSADSSAVNESAAATTDGSVDATLQMLQSAGIGDGNPEFRGAIAMQIAADGQSIVLRYFEDHPNVDRLLDSIESVAGTTPLPVIAEPVDYAVGAREQLARELVTPESGVAAEYGIGAPTSAWVDELTGAVSVTLAGPIPASAALVDGKNLISIAGVPVKVFPAASVAVDFQVSREGDLPAWSGGVKN